ncbi:MAG: GTPase RsgA, partial [Clostridia bacterium]|nr:GTPase RsgA [Clostridia bacterium]
MSKLHLKGRVISGVGGIYTVYCNNNRYKCFARGKLRRQGEIYIGDIVEFSYDREGIIEKVLPRKSKLVRPYVSNMDILLIIIADIPRPDMLLLDKLVIGADEQGVEAVIAINKCDKIEAVHLADSIEAEYKNIADIIKVSANTGYGIDELKAKIKGKYVCLAGQSAVGKSSLINSLLGRQVSQTGELSIKS